ncbi:hypothetical protein JR316_0001479 [Psilocybe cubensis]|nr:hypothetical protein JR316_0001479 [Psilocybe cubensis]KAH9487404.1 hypothetical protein JR316_0001479 [Psilocybe cubensis]
MIGIRDDDTLPAYTHDPFYQRILRTIAYSLQHPKATDPNGTRNPYFSLGRFIDSYIHSRGNNIAKSQFNAFCIVETEEKTIPDHYGHSSAASRVRRKPTEAEKKMDRLYRRALVFPTLNGSNPHEESLEERPVEQCAENIALPYILKAAIQFLANNEQGNRVISVYSLSMSTAKEPIAFCLNCRRHATDLVRKTLGLRIVDRAHVIYQSDATYALWASDQQGDFSSNSNA